jgi:ferrous iron transport protein B
VKLLQEDEDVYKKMHDEPIWIELLPIVREGLNHLYLHNNTKDLDEIFADEHFAFDILHLQKVQRWRSCLLSP